MIRKSSKWIGRVMTFEPVEKSKVLFPWSFTTVKRLTAFIERFDDKDCIWLFIPTVQMDPFSSIRVTGEYNGWWQVRLIEIDKPRKISIENEILFKLQHNVSAGGKQYEKTSGLCVK